MIRKGFVSSVSGTNARITFPDLSQVVSYELPICPHVGEVLPGDKVIVAFWGTNLSDGAIIGKVE